jgi:pimeloyl-ACP methyl ester carboxylesterase
MNNSIDTLREKLKEQTASMRQNGFIDAVLVNGMSIEYWRVGTGEKVVVFIHGNSSCKEVFSEQLNNMDTRGYSFVSIDLPGHGGSDNALMPEVTYTIPGYAKIISEVLKILEIPNYSVVGWSLGGNIGIEMMGQGAPINAIMIMGAPPIGPGIENIEKAYLPSSLEAPGKADLSESEMTDFVKAIYGTLKPIPAALYQIAKRTDGQAREIMIEHWMGGGPGHKQTHTVANWRNPLTIIQGENEPFVALNYLENIQWGNLWKGEIKIIKSAGHAPFIEKPIEFNNSLLTFIEDNI